MALGRAPKSDISDYPFSYTRAGTRTRGDITIIRVTLTFILSGDRVLIRPFFCSLNAISSTASLTRWLSGSTRRIVDMLAIDRWNSLKLNVCASWNRNDLEKRRTDVVFRPVSAAPAHQIRDDVVLIVAHEVHIVRLDQYARDVFDLVVQDDVFLAKQL